MSLGYLYKYDPPRTRPLMPRGRPYLHIQEAILDDQNMEGHAWALVLLQRTVCPLLFDGLIEVSLSQQRWHSLASGIDHKESYSEHEGICL